MSTNLERAIAASIAEANGFTTTDQDLRAILFVCHLAGYLRKDYPDFAADLRKLAGLEAHAQPKISQPGREAAC